MMGPKLFNRVEKAGVTHAREGHVGTIIDSRQDLAKRTRFHPKMQG